MAQTRVVHCKRELYDIYIGRGRCPKTGAIGEWGNPFTAIQHKKTAASYQVETVEEAVESYRKWLPTQPRLMAKLHTLKGKVLGCWCHPKPCHGQPSIDLIEQLFPDDN